MKTRVHDLVQLCLDNRMEGPHVDVELFTEMLFDDIIDLLHRKMYKYKIDESNNPNWYKVVLETREHFLDYKMNEKLLELAEQAGWMMDKEIEGFNTRLEKFAELFLDECVDTMIPYRFLEDHGDWLREKLREKFGFQNKKSHDELKPTPYPYSKPMYSNGCPVCGMGKGNIATGYVCYRDDCPTRITC